MKKLLLIGFIFMISCKTTKEVVKDNIIIDGCEYVESFYTTSDGETYRTLTHKPDCKEHKNLTFKVIKDKR